jgi:segregation and condensation protein A
VPVLVVSFLALLELTREALIDLTQKSPFDPIYATLKSERATLTIA